jgi:ribonuclease HI
VERCSPRRRLRTPWANPPTVPRNVCHAWTDGSFRASAGCAFVITRDAEGRAPIFQKSRCLGSGQAAFDAELEGIKGALTWHLQNSFRHMIIHSDSTSAIERAGHTGVRPGQRVARDIFRQVSSLNAVTRSADIQWAKGHSGAPGNEAADALAGMEGTKIKSSPVTSLTHLKTRIAKIYSDAKIAWGRDPGRIGRTFIAPPEEVLLGQSEELLSENGCADTQRSLAFSCLFQTHSKKDD